MKIHVKSRLFSLENFCKSTSGVLYRHQPNQPAVSFTAINPINLYRRFHQPSEKRQHIGVVVDEIFGMPLDAEGVGVVGNFGRFDHAVGRTGGDNQFGSHIPQRLVVEAVDPGGGRI
jgi:hypothetical protein